MECSRQEYWSGLPFPASGGLLDPGIKRTSPQCAALTGGFFTTEPPGKTYQAGIVDWKKICTTYKLRIVFYLVYFEDLSPGGSLSDCPEEEPKDRGVFETETTQNIKGLLFVKENQTFQVNEFSPFLCMGRCNKSELTELFLWYAPYPSRVSILFFSILSPLRAHHWGTCSGWWLQHPLFSGGWCCFIHMG